MNHNLTFDFVVDKAKNTITVKREFDAEVALVWDAYTKSSILDLWGAPKPWKAKTKTQEFKNGGHWIYAMVGPAGEEHWAVCEYKDIVPGKSFSGLDAFSDSNGTINKEMPQSKWEVKFNSMGDRTLVEFKIVYPDLAQLEATIQMGFKEGLAMAMEGLDELLPTLKK